MGSVVGRHWQFELRIETIDFGRREKSNLGVFCKFGYPSLISEKGASLLGAGLS